MLGEVIQATCNFLAKIKIEGNPGTISDHNTINLQCCSLHEVSFTSPKQKLFYSAIQQKLVIFKQLGCVIYPVASPNACRDISVRNLFKTSIQFLIGTASSRLVTVIMSVSISSTFKKLPQSPFREQTLHQTCHCFAWEKGIKPPPVKTGQNRIPYRMQKTLHVFLLSFFHLRCIQRFSVNSKMRGITFSIKQIL